MRRGSVIALLLAVAFVAPSAASAARAAATREDRAFAHAFERYDARTRQIAADPALVAALRARQQTGTGCIDAARALGQTGDPDYSFEAQLFYTLYVTGPFLEPLERSAHDYRAALRRLHLREPTLRSARAVLLALLSAQLPSQATLSDFCGPLRAWQSAGFAQAAEPAPFTAVERVLRHAPSLTVRRHATMRRVAALMRATGMSRAARSNLSQGGEGVEPGPSLSADPVLQALQT
jgi:hypothetical protein